MTSKRFFLPLILLVSACATTQSVPRGPLHEKCVDGDYDACVTWGDEESTHGPAGKRNALIAYQYACTANHAESCGRLAEFFGRNQADPQRVLTTLDAACSGGDQESCVRLGKLIPRRKAIPLFRTACDADVAQGCAELAATYRDAWQLGDYLAQSVALDEKACGLGYFPGCVAAGQAYLFGAGVPEDRAKGLKYLEATCSERESSGCLLLAKIYEEGMGVPVDLKRSNSYYEVAANQEQVVSIDTAQLAFVVHVDGCNHGDPLGCFNAGVMLHEGVEVDRNLSTARELFDQACQDGSDLACERMKRIKISIKQTSGDAK